MILIQVVQGLYWKNINEEWTLLSGKKIWACILPMLLYRISRYLKLKYFTLVFVTLISCMSSSHHQFHHTADGLLCQLYYTFFCSTWFFSTPVLYWLVLEPFFVRLTTLAIHSSVNMTGIPNRSIPPPWSKWLVQEWARDLNQSVGENCRTFGRIWIRNFISATERHKDGVNVYLLLPWEGNFQKMKYTEEIRVKEGKWESSFECLEPALPEALDFHLH